MGLRLGFGSRRRPILWAGTAAVILVLSCGCPPPSSRFVPPTTGPVPSIEEPPPTPADAPAGEPEVKKQDHPPGPAEEHKPLDSSGVRLITVPANRAWTDTGLDVEEGQKWTVLAEGAVSLQKGNPTAVCGPDGYGLKTVQQPLPYQNIGALIGRIVLLISVRTDPQTGNPLREEMVEIFPVGRRAEITVPLRGRLFLGINEQVVGDNDGAYRVKLYLSH